MMDKNDSLQSYVENFPPIREKIPLVHVLPSVSLEKVIESGVINPTANSRVNKITRHTKGHLLAGDGTPVDAGIASRIGTTDVASELNTPMVHFSLGVPYYRPSFSTNKRDLGHFQSCALIFDSDDIDIDHIYGNDSGSFVMNFQHGKAIPQGVTLQGMKLDSMESARRYVNALYGSVDAYLHGTTTREAPKGNNPHAHFIYNMLKNPLHKPDDAKDASVVAEIKTSKPVDLSNLKGIVMPAASILQPAVKQFLIDHPQVKFRLYTSSPWVGPEECHGAVLNETFKLYRDMGISQDIGAEKSLFSEIGDTVKEVKAARANQGGMADRFGGRPKDGWAKRP